MAKATAKKEPVNPATALVFAAPKEAAFPTRVRPDGSGRQRQNNPMETHVRSSWDENKTWQFTLDQFGGDTAVRDRAKVLAVRAAGYLGLGVDATVGDPTTGDTDSLFIRARERRTRKVE